MMKQLVFLGVLLILAHPVAADLIKPNFSIDPASPSIDGTVTPDDILKPGPMVQIAGTSLGLKDNVFRGVFDNLEAISFGQDPIQNPLFFSVDRVAVGLPQSDVFRLAQPGVEDAARHAYIALPPFSTNRRALNGRSLGLQGGFFGDDLDGLEVDTRRLIHTYFSIDLLSASNAFGALDFANDIFVDVFPNIYATGETDIMLKPKDDLDALVLFDVTPDGMGGVLPVPDGRLQPGLDMALFSLSTFSPSTFTGSGTPYCPGVKGFLSPGDILFTKFLPVGQLMCEGQLAEPQNWTLWASAADIGLRRDDNVDALDTVVPEPATLGLMAIGLLGLGVYRYRWRSKRGTQSCVAHAWPGDPPSTGALLDHTLFAKKGLGQ